jgi:hypothetical protein
METRVISLEQSPEATFPGMISELLRMNGNYLMTINFHVPSKEKEMQFLKLKGALAFTHRFNVLGDISIESPSGQKRYRRDHRADVYWRNPYRPL